MEVKCFVDWFEDKSVSMDVKTMSNQSMVREMSCQESHGLLGHTEQASSLVSTSAIPFASSGTQIIFGRYTTHGSQH